MDKIKAVKVTHPKWFEFNEETGTIIGYSQWERAPINVVIPEYINGVKVKAIGWAAFKGCIRVESVVLPATLTKLGSDIFKECTNLSKIVSKSPRYRVEGDRCLISNKTNTLLAFAQAGCQEIYVPEGIRVLGNRVFFGCQMLKKVHLPCTLVAIRRWAFRGCMGIKSITLPSTLREMSPWVFGECYALRDISVAKAKNSLYGAPWRAPKASVHWEDKDI